MNTRNVRDGYLGLGSYGTVGLELVLSILFGFFGGRWVDEKVGGGGWITLVGFVVGAVAGFRSLYRAAIRMRREAEAQDEADRRKNAGGGGHDDA